MLVGPLGAESGRIGDYVFYFYRLRFENGIPKHFPFALGVSIPGYVSLEETHPAGIMFCKVEFKGFFEGNTSIFPGRVRIAPAEVGVVVMRGQVVVTGFYSFVFL